LRRGCIRKPKRGRLEKTICKFCEYRENTTLLCRGK
jgi:hypothetical protein